MSSVRRAAPLTAARIRRDLSRIVGFWIWRKRADDQFIAAFPRSGGTWLRTMICNVLMPEANSDPAVFNKVIPGITIRGALKANRNPSPRLIQTHSCWRPDIPRAVYMLRDGRDAIDSLYHYHVTRRGRQQSFERFLHDYLRGDYGPLWHENVLSWLREGQAAMGNRLLILRFEDLVSDPTGNLSRTLDFLSIDAPQSTIEAAVEAASLKNVQRLERLRRGDIESRNASFYRGGRIGSQSEAFTDSLREQFVAVSKPGLLAANYTD